ncbi:MAG: 2,3-bisphosphoglycerate-independent phosphoglycerate mutase, partial [Firmicutes bacterium]|nr:2,3-bisphosphoglycerate-independent phosphoglycerate mutase [Bacillota bacterium]
MKKSIAENKKPTVLMILDGFGLSESEKMNAVLSAKTPNLDKIFAKYPFVRGGASGLDVGLPEGQMGNSEVGHLNIGAGRIVYQELTRISKDIEDGGFFENETLLSGMNHAREKDSSVHIMGLLSDGGVHSHSEHLYALLKLAKRCGLEKVYVHCFMDGRDTPPRSGKAYIEELISEIENIGVGEIATISGRYYAMDRDQRWERIELAYNALVNGTGEFAYDPVEAMELSYSKDITDEFVLPVVITDKNGCAKGKISDSDTVIFYNFRPDRARQLTRAFCDPEFKEISVKHMDLKYICFTDYDPGIPNKTVAYHPQSLENTLGEYLSSIGKRQLRLAETEKYAHVTFFFNGGVEEPNPGEDRILIPSPKVATYDLKPEM